MSEQSKTDSEFESAEFKKIISVIKSKVDLYRVPSDLFETGLGKMRGDFMTLSSEQLKQITKPMLEIPTQQLCKDDHIVMSLERTVSKPTTIIVYLSGFFIDAAAKRTAWMTGIVLEEGKNPYILSAKGIDNPSFAKRRATLDDLRYLNSALDIATPFPQGENRN